jgi:hypothetical protein
MNLLPQIVILAIPIFLLLILGRMFLKHAQRKRALRRLQLELDERMDRAVVTEGTIIWATTTGRTNGRKGGTEVELLLQIDLPGEKPYQANVNWLVNKGDLSQMQSGRKLSVKVDVDDPRRIYPTTASARYCIQD